MARRVTLAVLLIASIIFNLCASAAVRRQRIVDWDGRFSFAAEDVNVWLADDEGVWRSYKRTTPKFVVELPGIIALDAYDGSVYALRKDGADNIVSFIEPENGVTQEWLLPDLGGYCGIAALQDKIALLAGKQDECTLVFLDKANGTVQEIEGAENLAYISRRSETSVFASSLTEGKIISIDTDGAIEEIFRGGFYAKSVYEKEGGTILLFGQSEGRYMISRMKPGEEPEELGVIDIPGLIYGGKIDEDDLYVDANHTLYQIDIAELETIADNAPTQVLTIAMHDYTNTRELSIAARAFEAAHPGLGIEYVKGTSEDLTLMLMADPSHYDLLHLDWSGADPFLRTDIIEDLSAYPELMEQKQNWIDIGAMYDAQGRWVRVPLTVQAPFVYLPIAKDWRIYDRIGMEWNGEGMDYGQFLELCRKAREEDVYFLGMDHELDEWLLLYSTMYGNSVDEGVLHFDTPEFRQMMEFLKTLYTEDLAAVKEGNEFLDPDRILADSERWMYTLYRPRQFSLIMDGRYLYPPTPDGEKISIAPILDALYLNRYSEQKELAVEFIASYMSPEVQSQLIVDTDPEKSVMFLNDYSLYENIEDNVFYWMYNFNSKTYANWIEVLENSRYPGGLMQLRPDFWDMLHKYLEDEMELEEFVAEMEKLADIWMYE